MSYQLTGPMTPERNTVWNLERQHRGRKCFECKKPVLAPNMMRVRLLNPTTGYPAGEPLTYHPTCYDPDAADLAEMAETLDDVTEEGATARALRPVPFKDRDLSSLQWIIGKKRPR